MIKKIVLYKINKIIMNELKRGYYENAANVKTVIELERRPFDDTYMHIENLVIWQNGFFKFTKFNLTTPAIRNSISLVKKKVLSKR